MTATERLRELLDERGVEYRAIGDATFWETHDGAFRYKAESHAEKLMVMTCCSQKCTVMTPEQAIAATLGAGTCHNTWDVELTGRLRFQCSECGGVSLEITPNFCPNCGRRVSSEHD